MSIECRSFVANCSILAVNDNLENKLLSPLKYYNIFHLLGHGPTHSILVSTVGPEQGIPSGEGVGLVHPLVLLTTDPPQGFSHIDH